MTSVTSSAASACSQGDEGAWKSGVSSVSDTVACEHASRSTRVSNQGANSRREIWFYTNARQRLMAEQNNTAALSPYGTAHQHQLRQAFCAETSNIVRFEVLPSDVLPSAVGQMRTEANRRSTRLRQRSQLPHDQVRDTMRSAGSAMLATDGAPGPQDAVGRLVNVLNDCDAKQQGQQQPRPGSAAQKSLHASNNNSRSATLFLTPHAPHVRRRPNSATAALASHIADLTRNWLSREVAEAATIADAAAQQRSADRPAEHATHLRMPKLRAISAHAAPLASNSCVMRLRKSKFERVNPAAATSASSVCSTHPASSPSSSRHACGGGAGVCTTPFAPPAAPPAKASRAQKSSAECALELRLAAEPIRSYRILHDAITPSMELYPSSHIPLFEAARLRRANLERLTHNFEHQRYVLHEELESALDWRGQCQAAVLRQRGNGHSTSGIPGAPQMQPRSPALPTLGSSRSSDNVYQGLLDEVFAQQRCRRPTAGPTVTTSASSLPFRSVWSKEAARLALLQERERLVCSLNAFESKCDAAALTLAAVEDLRAETVQRVCNPETFSDHGSAIVFTRERFLKFIQARYPSNVPSFSDAGVTRHPSDILEALPSKAEAAFAKYAYEVLPSCCSVST
jgi:hypothetical protein